MTLALSAIRRWYEPTLVFIALGLFTYSFLSAELHLHNGFLVDDAYISLRYSKNLAEGFGLNFNHDDRVEGYTNFTLTVLAAIPYRFGMDPVLFVKTLGWMSGASLVVSTYALVRRISHPLVATVLVLVMALDPRFGFFSSWGLETMMVSAFYVPAFLALDKKRYVLAGILFCLAVMTRMETMMLFGMACLLALWQSGIRRPRDFSRIRALLPFPLAFGIPYFTYYAWRWSYYGYPFPNTYYAKVGSVSVAWHRGVDYVVHCAETMNVRDGMVATGVALVVIVVLRATLAILGRGNAKATDASAKKGVLGAEPERDGLGAVVVGSTLLYGAYVVSVGGDHFQERFIYHFYPLLLASVGFIWWELVRTLSFGRVPPRACIVISAFLALLIVRKLPVAETFFGRSNTLGGWASVGVWLRDHAKPDAVVATCAAGILPLESGRKTIDILGLNDTHIAHLNVAIGRGMPGHEKADPGYVLSRKPDYISTWIDHDGHVGRGFRKFYSFWLDYELIFLVRTDIPSVVSPERLIPVDHDLPLLELALGAQGRGARPGWYDWGVWGRRTRPPGPRPMGHFDLGSSVPPVAEDDPYLVRAHAGHAPGYLLWGPGMSFPAGNYRVTYDLHFPDKKGVADDTELCKFDVADGSPKAVFEETLLARDWLARDRTYSYELAVSPEMTSKNFEFRLYCFGRTDVDVRGGSIEKL